MENVQASEYKKLTNTVWCTESSRKKLWFHSYRKICDKCI